MNNDQYLLFFFIFGTLVIAGFSICLTAFLVLYKQKQVRNKLDRQQMEFNYASELFKTRLEVQEQALLHVSQEIHDNIGQVLSFSKFQLTALRSHIGGEQGQELLQQSEKLVGKAIQDLRLLSHSLNAPLIEKLDLEDSIEKELDRIRNFRNMDCVFTAEGEPADLPTEKRLILFRIIQEALQNILKHADARRLEVALHYEDTRLTVQVKDDGKGFHQLPSRQNASIGLLNMYNRADMLGGSLDINSAAGQGSVITLNVPI